MPIPQDGPPWIVYSIERAYIYHDFRFVHVYSSAGGGSLDGDDIELPLFQLFH